MERGIIFFSGLPVRSIWSTRSRMGLMVRLATSDAGTGAHEADMADVIGGWRRRRVAKGRGEKRQGMGSGCADVCMCVCVCVCTYVCVIYDV